MKESIIDIATAINRHRDLEITTETTNCAVGRSKTIYDGKEMQFWLIDSEGTVNAQRDFHGNIIPNTAYVAGEPYRKNGFTVPRRSLLASILIQNTEGVHIYKSPQGEKTIKILNRAVYEPSEKEKAENIMIRLANDGQNYSYQILEEILRLKKSLEEAERKVEEAQENDNKEEIQKLITELELKRKQFDEKLAKAKNFIRRHAELRYQPILDEIQDKIKSSNIFTGKLIINGGPGTGKTTSLIQRMKFLTSVSIEEFAELSPNQKQILFDQQRSWIFFTPTELLKLFLKNSMVKEDLAASDNTVRVWQDYKTLLFREYKLTDPSTQMPFKISRNDSEKILIPSDAANLKKFERKFQLYFLNLQKQKLKRLQNFDLSYFSWKSLGNDIKREVSNYEINEMIDAMRLYVNLEDKFAKQTKELSGQLNNLVTESAAKILYSLKNDVLRYDELADMLRSETRIELDEIDEPEDDEEETGNENPTDPSIDIDIKLLSVIKSLIRKNALKKHDKEVKFSTRFKKYLEKIPETDGVTSEIKIGEIAFFRKYFERLTNGLVSNMYREVSASYKRFRRSELSQNSKLWDSKILEKLIADNNSRLHIDEQAFLITFINNINILLSKNFRNIYNTANHPFIEGFRQNCKAVIGIDEATDFRLVDLLCMSSFNHPDFNSVTLSGDMMQKITKDGLYSWNDYLSFYKKTEIHNLEVSYRQSQTLLNLAQKIYRSLNSEDAVYRSYIAKSENEPEPLLYISEDNDHKLKWIVNRILEICKAYSFIPSIAIFLPDESQLESFADNLNQFDELFESGITVKACRNGEVLGNKDTVRVFSIDKIKGLEFDTVIFHNVDEILDNGLSTEMFYKYVYVGLSRASFYLGMTLNKQLPNEFSFLVDSFSTDATWQ